jgi:hypothetical protein
MKAGDTVHDPYFYPSFLRGLNARDSLEPESAEGIAYAITRDENRVPPEPIASLVATGRARLEAHFERRDGRRRELRAAVYRILPGPLGEAKDR